MSRPEPMPARCELLREVVRGREAVDAGADDDVSALAGIPLNCLLGNAVGQNLHAERSHGLAPDSQPYATSPAVERASPCSTRWRAEPASSGTNELARRTASTRARLRASSRRSRGRGLVEHVARDGRYRLGLRLLQLGNAVLAAARPARDSRGRTWRRSSRRPARPRRSRCPASATPSPSTSSQSPSSVQSVARLGRPSVAHATATGKVCLAFGDVPLPDGGARALHAAHAHRPAEATRPRSGASATGGGLTRPASASAT